jgi:outer membrane protein TolC
LLKDGVAVEVTQSYLALAQAKRRIELTKLAIDQAQENFRVTSEKFRTGLTTNSELLDAEVAQLQTKVQHVQALVDHEIARARLEKSLGTSEGN